METTQKDNWEEMLKEFYELSSKLREEFGLINKTMEAYRVEVALEESQLILSRNQEESHAD